MDFNSLFELVGKYGVITVLVCYLVFSIVNFAKGQLASLLKNYTLSIENMTKAVDNNTVTLNKFLGYLSAKDINLEVEKNE